jgi:hypothetical protein
MENRVVQDRNLAGRHRQPQPRETAEQPLESQAHVSLDEHQ